MRTLTKDEVYALHRRVWDIKHIDEIKRRINEIEEDLKEYREQLALAEKNRDNLSAYELVLMQHFASLNKTVPICPDPVDMD